MATIYYSDKFLAHDELGHVESANRLMVMAEALRGNGFHLTEPRRPASEGELLSVHSRELLETVKDASLGEKSWLDDDTYVCKGDFEVASLAAGTVVEACEKVSESRKESAFCLVRPPGHHATRENSMGFCLFNNVAVAAQKLASDGKAVLIFDHDVHHGNGTQDIFYSSNQVLYQSFHLSPHYPGTGRVEETGSGKGKGYNVNAPLPFNSGEEEVRLLLKEVFLPIAREFAPDVVIFSAGFDSHRADSLGGLNLSEQFFGELVARFAKVQPRIVCALEGGYNLRFLPSCVLSEVNALEGSAVVREAVSGEAHAQRLVGELKEAHASYWKL